MTEPTLVDVTNGNTYTTGRYVYRSKPRQWYWQCDLHDDDFPHAAWHTFPTMREAFDNAMIHAANCPFDSVNNRLLKRKDGAR